MVCVCVCGCMSAFYLILFLGSHKYLGACIFSNEIFFPTLLSVMFLIVSFSFTGTFILLTDSVYPQHVLSFLIVSSPHLYLQYWFSGDGWLFLLFQRVEVDKWFSNVHLSLSWLIDAFTENSTRIFQVLFLLSFCPKVSFYDFVCLQDRKLRKIFFDVCHHFLPYFSRSQNAVISNAFKYIMIHRSPLFFRNLFGNLLDSNLLLIFSLMTKYLTYTFSTDILSNIFLVI